MKRSIVNILLICFVLGSLLSFAGCSSASTRNENVVGVWKSENNPDYATSFQYIYVYADGTGDRYGYSQVKTNTSHCNPFEWQCNGDTFKIKSSAATYTVKDGKMYNKQGNVEYTLVSRSTSIDISIP